MNLSGRTAIVTGGAVRIGREIAERLASAGANVCVHCHRHQDEAEAFAAGLRAAGGQAAVVAADFLEPAPAAKFLTAECRRELGPATILINSAAIFEPATLADLTHDHWQRHLAINLAAPVFLSQAFAAQVPRDESAVIVNIVDWRGSRPEPGHLAYTAAKSGLVAMTKLLAQELGPRIRVNAIAPGAILPGPGQSAGEFERLGRHNPLQRTGEPRDIAEAVLYLAGAGFVTGEMLHVTGGEQL
ncbi:MAG: SDR family oxidoreductase [Planctomyces sp.]|nr:SDR family oxidoreductase [Planctomyces sp.]